MKEEERKRYIKRGDSKQPCKTIVHFFVYKLEYGVVVRWIKQAFGVIWGLFSSRLHQSKYKVSDLFSCNILFYEIYAIN